MRAVHAIGVIVCVAEVAAAQPDPTVAPPPPPEPDIVVVPPPSPEPATTPEPPQLSVTYDKGLAFAAPDGRYGLKLSFRSQFRFESRRPSEDDSQFASHFSIPRSRLQAEGYVFAKTTRYKLEFGLGDAGSFAFVKDLYFDQRISPAPVWFRAGVFRRPFNRQEIVADFASEFNERAITAAFVGGGRDLGIGVHNDLEKSPTGLEWSAAIFNGFSGGDDRPQQATTCTQDATGAITCTTPSPTNFPADFAPAVVVRAGWNTGGIKGYSEGDLEGGPLRMAVGGSYKIDLGNFAKQAEDSVADNLSHGVQVDAMLKAHGASAEIGLYLMKLPASRASNKSADAGIGAFLQGGYFVVPRSFQLAARFAIAPDARTVDRNQIEARAAVNWFWHGHAWKWATDVGVLTTTGEDPVTMTTDEPDLVIRSMLQLTL